MMILGMVSPDLIESLCLIVLTVLTQIHHDTQELFIDKSGVGTSQRAAVAGSKPCFPAVVQELEEVRKSDLPPKMSDGFLGLGVQLGSRKVNRTLSASQFQQGFSHQKNREIDLSTNIQCVYIYMHTVCVYIYAYTYIYICINLAEK
jgi:hypothetical protein